MTDDEINYVAKATDIAFAALSAVELICQRLADGQPPTAEGLAEISKVLQITKAKNRELKDAIVALRRHASEPRAPIRRH